MSKKHGSQKRKKSIPWVLLALGGILIIAAIFLFTDKSGADGGTPNISVDQERIDFGYIKLGEFRSFKIKVTNTGDGILRFSEKPYIQVLEGCCPPELKTGSMSLNPGESTFVQTPDFMMHEGMDGPHDFAVHLITNDADNSDHVVHVFSDWGP